MKRFAITFFTIALLAGCVSNPFSSLPTNAGIKMTNVVVTTLYGSISVGYYEVISQALTNGIPVVFTLKKQGTNDVYETKP